MLSLPPRRRGTTASGAVVQAPQQLDHVQEVAAVLREPVLTAALQTDLDIPELARKVERCAVQGHVNVAVIVVVMLSPFVNGGGGVGSTGL